MKSDSARFIELPNSGRSLKSPLGRHLP